MRAKEHRDEFRFAGGQVAEDHVDLFIGFAGCNDLSERTHEIPARLPSRRLALDLAVLHIQRGVDCFYSNPYRSIRIGEAP